MDPRYFSASPFQDPYNYYNYGRTFGYMQYPRPKPASPERIEKPSYYIDSLLTHRCSRDTRRDETRSQNGLLFSAGKTSQEKRFYPYYTSSYGQEILKSSSDKAETDRAVQRAWTLDKPKRMRTIFTVEQLERMEREFDRQQYMVGADRFFLANELGLTETQVKVWFQNRRIKWRKHILEKQHRELSEKMVANANM